MKKFSFLFVSTMVLILVLSMLITVSAETEWETFSEEDKITGEISWHAASPYVETEDLDIPFSDDKAKITISSDGEYEWVTLGFTSSPILTDSESRSGNRLFKVRSRWGEDYITNVKLIEENRDDDYLFFWDNSRIISYMKEYESLLLELNWYGQGEVYFEFPLEGAKEALNEIRNKVKVK